MNAELPDLIVGAYGLRTFRVSHDGQLLPVVELSAAWRDGVCQARCRRNRRHVAPTERCGCGIYCFKDLTTLRRQYPMQALVIVAVIRLEGDTLEGDKGYRTAAARVVALWVAPGTIPESVLAKLRNNLPTVTMAGDLEAMIGRYPDLTISPAQNSRPSKALASPLRWAGSSGAVPPNGLLTGLWPVLLRLIMLWVVPAFVLINLMQWATDWERSAVPIPNLGTTHWEADADLYATSRVFRSIGMATLDATTLYVEFAVFTAMLLLIWLFSRSLVWVHLIGMVLRVTWRWVTLLLLGGAVAAARVPGAFPLLPFTVSAFSCVLALLAVSVVDRRWTRLTGVGGLPRRKQGVRVDLSGWNSGRYVVAVRLGSETDPRTDGRR